MAWYQNRIRQREEMLLRVFKSNRYRILPAPSDTVLSRWYFKMVHWFKLIKTKKYVYKKHKIDWTNRKFCMLHHAVAYKISGFNYLAKPLRYLLICVDSTTTLILYSLPPPFVAPTPKHNCNKLILYQEEGVQTANRQVTHLSCSTFFVETRQNPLLSFCERCRTFFPRCRGPPLLKSSILPKFQKMGGLLYVAGVHKESRCDPLTETKYR